MTKAEKKQAAAGRAYWKAVDKQGRTDAALVRERLSGDPGWALFTKKDLTDEENTQRWRSIGRLTKAAVRVLYPQYKVSCTAGRGTGSNWTHVNIEAPEIELAMQASRKSYDHGLRKGRNITTRVRAMLDVVGIPYGKYLPDCIPGKDEWTNCLLVNINGWG